MVLSVLLVELGCPTHLGQNHDDGILIQWFSVRPSGCGQSNHEVLQSGEEFRKVGGLGGVVVAVGVPAGSRKRDGRTTGTAVFSDLLFRLALRRKGNGFGAAVQIGIHDVFGLRAGTLHRSIGPLRNAAVQQRLEWAT